SGVRAAGALRLFTGCGTREYDPTEAAVAHAADSQPRELKRTVEVDPYCFAPHLRVLFPHEPLVSRADTRVHDQQIHGSQPTPGLGYGQSTTLGGSEISRDTLRANPCHVT